MGIQPASYLFHVLAGHLVPAYFCATFASACKVAETQPRPRFARFAFTQSMVLVAALCGLHDAGELEGWLQEIFDPNAGLRSGWFENCLWPPIRLKPERLGAEASPRWRKTYFG